MCGLSLPAEKWHKEVLKVNRPWFMQATRCCYSSMDGGVTCNVTHQFDFHTQDHMEPSAYQVRNQLHVPALNAEPQSKKNKKHTAPLPPHFFCLLGRVQISHSHNDTATIPTQSSVLHLKAYLTSRSSIQGPWAPSLWARAKISFLADNAVN